jgi:hypothetical protein
MPGTFTFASNFDAQNFVPQTDFTKGHVFPNGLTFKGTQPFSGQPGELRIAPGGGTEMSRSTSTPI